MTADITTSRKTRPRGYIANYQPQQKTVNLIRQVQAVLDEYRDYWPLTIRQIFYRLVGKYDYAKDEAAYERLCTCMNNARRAKIISFHAIRDDGVVTITLDHFNDADHFRRSVTSQAAKYRKNVMAMQEVHIEVWCEAAGMMGQLDRVASQYSIRVYSSSGFDSTTARKALADRICNVGKPAVILHLGDYDPSGAAIFQSLVDDVSAFVEADRPWNDITVRFERVALTAEQVVTFGLATAPAKASDSRSKRWAGETCQLEALSPPQIAVLLKAAIVAELNMMSLEAARLVEKDEREELTKLLLTGPDSKRGSQ